MASLADQWRGSPSYFLGGLVFATSLDNLLMGVLALETFSYWYVIFLALRSRCRSTAHSPYLTRNGLA